jgi:hypothetical protein
MKKSNRNMEESMKTRKANKRRRARARSTRTVKMSKKMRQ